VNDVVSTLTEVVMQSLCTRCIRPGLCCKARCLVVDNFDLRSRFMVVKGRVSFLIKFFGRFIQNSFVKVLATPTLHRPTFRTTWLIADSISWYGLYFYDVREDLDHLGISEEALEKIFFVLGFHLTHQYVVKLIKIDLLFADRFGIGKLVHHFALAN